MSTSLTRSQFETACKAYIDKHGATPAGELTFSSLNPSGWTWKGHQFVPDLGYMSRSVSLFPRVSTIVLDDSPDLDSHSDLDSINDEAVAAGSRDVLNCNQSVVYSATFQVPTFYFTLHRSNGTPLPITDILCCSLLRPRPTLNSEVTSFALSDSGSSFSLLSQGDHPILGTPSWYLHPCHTQEAVGEVMTEVQQNGWSEEQRLVRWMEAWFMVVGQIIDLACGT